MHSNNADDLLQFQDYSNTSNSPPAQINVNSPTTSLPSGQTRRDPLSGLIYDMSNTASVLAAGDAGIPSQQRGDGLGGEPSANAAKLSFLSMEYYQQFFNVDTFMVLERIYNSMVPKRAGPTYLTTKIEENPDLYGPFWINVTLIFCIAISGNIANYLQYASDTYRWHYNFHLVSYAATCIFVYVNLLPAALWVVFKYTLKPSALDADEESESATYTPSLLSLMCVYGYSLAIYIPVSILWVIPFSFLQWILVITAALLSGVVLITVLSPALRNSRYSLFLIVGILGAHFLLAAGFMLYFFHVPNDQPERLGEVPSAQIKQAIVETVTKALAGDIIPPKKSD